MMNQAWITSSMVQVVTDECSCSVEYLQLNINGAVLQWMVTNS